MRSFRVLLVPAGLALGLTAEWAALRRGPLEEAVTAQDWRLAAGDFLVGIALVTCGVVASSRRPESRVGVLLVVSGFAWFLGTFGSSGATGFAGFGALFVTAHRGPLVHAILSYPRGRLSGRLELAVVTTVYLDGAFVALAQKESVTLAVCAIVAATALRRYAGVSGSERHARAPALAAAIALAAILGLGATAGLADAGAGVGRAVLWGYEVVVLAIAVVFLLDLLAERWTRATVTGLVVDLGNGDDRGTLRERLAFALGDRSLIVGYWLPERGRYVDDRGAPIELPGPGSGREVTRVDSEGEPVGVLVHDTAVVDDAKLVDSVAAAARLAVSNVRLQADVRRQVEELEASRRRIVEAGDAQRRRLERELSMGAERRLARVGELLGTVAPTLRGNGAFAATLAGASIELAHAQAELREFAGGIHPRVLTEEGLAAALQDLVRRAPVPVELRAPTERFPPMIEAAAYFLSSEALVNIAKYAMASRATVEVACVNDALIVEVTDDGVGGANLGAGTGLRGLDDRVAVLGGRLSVNSPPGEGTIIRAELPLA
ncbi:MAG TPA: ATP-binding protein [Gaiellaceae bacterium]